MLTYLSFDVAVSIPNRVDFNRRDNQSQYVQVGQAQMKRLLRTANPVQRKLIEVDGPACKLMSNRGQIVRLVETESQ